MDNRYLSRDHRSHSINFPMFLEVSLHSFYEFYSVVIPLYRVFINNTTLYLKRIVILKKPLMYTCSFHFADWNERSYKIRIFVSGKKKKEKKRGKKKMKILICKRQKQKLGVYLLKSRASISQTIYIERPNLSCPYLLKGRYYSFSPKYF